VRDCRSGAMPKSKELVSLSFSGSHSDSEVEQKSKGKSKLLQKNL
jgi:butyrate kinase